MEIYSVKKYVPRGQIFVSVPASKSILNRALLLAAFGNNDVLLKCNGYASDTRALIVCLDTLGVPVEPHSEGLLVHGGKIHQNKTNLFVESAGTAARFLPVMLAFRGGDYSFSASEQMERRPMEHLKILESLGVQFFFAKQPYRFPFRMMSESISADTICVNTDESTQYASSFLLAAATKPYPVKIRLSGGRVNGSYIRMTIDIMKAFHVPVLENENEITVSAPETSPTKYFIEPDLSAACYFYALSLLFGVKVCVRGVFLPSIQGDRAFLKLLSDRGVVFTQTETGLTADGSKAFPYAGFCEDLNDFSDQTLTVAALAPFASSPSVLKNVAHIRKQECDRVMAICTNLNALGVPAKFENNAIIIHPAPVKGGLVHTFHDHRVAMAFSLIGLKTGNIQIEDPDCCKKTFENYFDLISKLTEVEI